MIIAVAIRDLVQGYMLSLPAPNRHSDVIRDLVSRGHCTPINGEQGFVDDQRGFVNRVEAAEIAINQGQIRTQLLAPPNLFSEDLW